VVSLGQNNLPLALVLVMVFSLILGMGIPTIPNYIITSSLAAPILLPLGVPLLVSHMYVFYFGIMADLTPPVALAAFAAAPMAKESGLKIGIQAVRIALPAFIVPYLTVADPVLLLQPVARLDGIAYWLDVVYVSAKATLAVVLWGIAAFGYANGKVNWAERALSALAAGFLIFPTFASDIAGLHWRRACSPGASSPPARRETGAVRRFLGRRPAARGRLQRRDRLPMLAPARAVATPDRSAGPVGA
jgi:TRAP-type uncharacterized transport system fused permease subunit